MTAGLQTAPLLTLPASYSFNDAFFSADIRISRSWRVDRAQLRLFAEVFNVFNTANLVGYDGNLASTASFGQPGARFTQVFGSGGPRAGQIGARVTF